MNVLILGNAQDLHAAHMQKELTRRGATARYFDLGDFPMSLRLAHDFTKNRSHIRWSDGFVLDVAEVRSVYWRNYNKTVFSPEQLRPGSIEAYVAEHDTRSLAESALMDWPVQWVNGWEGFSLHQRKPAALARVQALGDVLIPETIVANDIDALLAFGAEHGDCIIKPVQGGAHARRLRREDLVASQVPNVCFCPVTVQREIPGTNIRVYAIGSEIYGAEVATEHVDYRDDRDPRVRRFDVPAEIGRQARRIADALSLAWTGIDYRLTPDGKFYYLEANPSPMFTVFEELSGQPLTDALCRLLMGEQS